MGKIRVKMKIFAILGSALAFGPQFPSEFDYNNQFWLNAVGSSRSGGFSQINNIRCNRMINIEGAGRGEKHTKSCVVNFEALDTSSGYSDIINCHTQVSVTACKFCRSAPVFDASPARCGPVGNMGGAEA